MRLGSETFRTLDDLDVSQRRVFFRADLNVPMEDGVITDDTRIRAILPTLQELLSKRAWVVLASHLGRPKGKPDPKFSMVPVGQRLAELLHREVIVPDECVGDGVKKVLIDQIPAQVVLLENLRYHAQEEANDAEFAKALKGRTDLYLTDAFGALHRAHASTAALPKLYEERGIGRLVQSELTHLTPLLGEPKRPYAVVLGGAKVSDKLKVIEHLLKRVDRIFLGGAMVFTFLKARGHQVGASLVDPKMLFQVERVMEEAKKRGVEIVFPKDFMVAKSVAEPEPFEVTRDVRIPEGRMGLDIGPQTIELFTDKLKECATVFWNGPMGLFEVTPFDRGTLAVANVLASMDDAVRVLGGGDSVAAAAKAGVLEKMTHVSTGGGATLEFLEGRSLPGLQAVAV